MSDRRHTPRPTLPEGYQYGEMSRAVKRRDAAEREWFASVTPWPPCGHLSQVAGQYKTVTLDDGRTELQRTAQTFRARVGDARLCAGCGQLVDDVDDAEAMAAHGWRAPHENAAAQLTRQAQRTGDETL